MMISDLMRMILSNEYDLTVWRTSSILRINDWMSSRLALKFSRVCGNKELSSFLKSRKGRRRKKHRKFLKKQASYVLNADLQVGHVGFEILCHFVPLYQNEFFFIAHTIGRTLKRNDLAITWW